MSHTHSHFLFPWIFSRSLSFAFFRVLLRENRLPCLCTMFPQLSFFIFAYELGIVLEQIRGKWIELNSTEHQEHERQQQQWEEKTEEEKRVQIETQKKWKRTVEFHAHKFFLIFPIYTHRRAKLKWKDLWIVMSVLRAVRTAQSRAYIARRKEKNKLIIRSFWLMNLLSPAAKAAHAHTQTITYTHTCVAVSERVWASICMHTLCCVCTLTRIHRCMSEKLCL